MSRKTSSGLRSPARGRLSLHWDSYRSWVDGIGLAYNLFVQRHADQDQRAARDESVSSQLWSGYFDAGCSFLFEQYGVMLECPLGYSTEIMRGTTATFCATSPSRDVFSFPSVNARWMTRDDLCEVACLRQDAVPPQGMGLVCDATTTRQPLRLPPYLSFAARLDFKRGATDALWAAQRRGERIKITYIMWGVLGEPNELSS